MAEATEQPIVTEQPKENVVKKPKENGAKKATAQKEQSKDAKKPVQQQKQKQKKQITPAQKKAQAQAKKKEARLENIKVVEEAVQVLIRASRIDYDVPVYRLTDAQKKIYFAQQLAKQTARSLDFDSDFRPYLVNAKRQVLGTLAEQVSYMAALTDSMDSKFEQEKNKNNFDEAAQIMKLEQTVYNSIDSSTKSMLEAGKAAIKAGMGTRWQKKLYDEENKENEADNSEKTADATKVAETAKATVKETAAKVTAKKTA